MSDLVAEGHDGAPDYPIAFVWEEVQIAAERKNRILASEATILQAAITYGVDRAVAKDMGKKAGITFMKMVNSLIGEDEPDERKHLVPPEN